MSQPSRARSVSPLLRIAATSVLLGSMSVSLEASPQCEPHWLPGYGVPGANIFVSASTSWDPDGAGPEPEYLVIAGGFNVVGDQEIQGLAGWDGLTWRAMDPGSGGEIYTISALAVYRGELIAAGNFSTLSGVALNNIARFDGENWRPLGTGQANGITGTLGYGWVNTLRVVGDRLLVGGFFDLAGGVSAVNIAAWDGATETWHALGDGLSIGQFYEGVYGITEFGGEIVAAGDFTQSGPDPIAGIARFDGTRWHGFPPVDFFFPSETGTFGGQLLVGGIFFDINNTDPLYFGDSIVLAWDELLGEWTQLGGTLGTPFVFGIEKLAEYGGELYASGDFLEDIFDQDAPGNLLRRWDGRAWQIVGEGISGFNWFPPTILTLEVHQGRLIAGGSFSHADKKGAFNLAAWDGARWDAFSSGTNGRIGRLLPFHGGIVASGLFDTIEGAPVRRLAYWDGFQWSSFGDGSLPSPAPLGEFRGELVVSDFSVDGRVRRWDGAVWQPFGEGIPDGFVSQMAEYEGKLVVGGSFSFTGYYGDQIDGVAQWDGLHWRALGSGVTGTSWGSPVFAMAVYKGKLIVAGGLDTAGGQPANAIASWDGKEWEPLGSGLTEPPGNVVVWDIEVYHDELVATGQFFVAGGVPARDIARWDGRAWHPLGSDGTSTLYDWGQVLLAHGDDLYVGGDFWVAGGVEVRRIARWDGEQWYALDGGVDPQWYGGVNALARQGNQLLVGGDFTQTGAGVSAFLARLVCQ